MNDQHTPGPDRPADAAEPERAAGEPAAQRPDDVEHTLQLPQDRPGPYDASPTSRPGGRPSYAAGPAVLRAPPARPGRSRWTAPGGPGFGPGRRTAPAGYAGYGAAGANPPSARSDRATAPKSLLPLVAVVALLVGLVGGALGGVAVEKWNDANQEPGRTSGGLADVDTVAKAPLPADNGSIASVAAEAAAQHRADRRRRRRPGGRRHRLRLRPRQAGPRRHQQPRRRGRRREERQDRGRRPRGQPVRRRRWSAAARSTTWPCCYVQGRPGR